MISPQTFEYEGEGWGLCYDGSSLFMTDGSGTMKRRDPATFDILEEIRVTRDGFSVRDLNELECVDDYIYANIYQSDEIVRIDKATGTIIGEMDAFGLSSGGNRGNRPADPGAVLNGIAYDPATGVFYVTGKLWPTLFEIVITGG